MVRGAFEGEVGLGMVAEGGHFAEGALAKEEVAEDGSIVAVGSAGDWEKDSVGCVDFSDVLFANVPRGRRFRAGEVSFVHSVAAPSELLPFAPLMM